MLEIPSLRFETTYGIPTGSDQLLFNHHYVIGYSNLFRQARFALELVTAETLLDEVERRDVFRSDPRVHSDFAATLDDFKGSGFHRGHLVCSADQLATKAQNSDTFLLSNMCPQLPALNSGPWAHFEAYIRQLAKLDDILQVYVACGPLFKIGSPIRALNKRLPVPHGFWKSILSVTDTGRLRQLSFVFNNQTEAEAEKPFQKCQVTTRNLEAAIGLHLWDRVRDLRFQASKGTKRKLITV